MTLFSNPIVEIIARRFSCRTYVEQPLDEETVRRLRGVMEGPQVGPLGSAARFQLVAATAQDRDSLKGLGTYGFIQGATAFIIGACKPAPKDMEDYGYLLERIVLFATDLGLGTCWLGGTFTRSGFADKIGASAGEQIPAVSPVGRAPDPEKARNTLMRRQIRADERLPWEQLFFDGAFGRPLAREVAAAYAEVLDMVRLAPSASNKQPWRIVRDGNAWHLYVQRTAGYHKGLAGRLLNIADLQRVDAGIAMCHLQLTADELGLGGNWNVHEPDLRKPDDLTEYTVTWQAS
jgi:hypothetical protein